MSRILTRREMLTLMSTTLVSGSLLRAQEAGMATRGLAPAPRPKFSGKPFGAHLVDVGQAAGLRMPSICGAVDRTKYLIETTGTGIAFLDYDNDGWLDIFRRPMPPTVFIETIETAHLPTSPRKQDWFAPAGQWA